MARAGALRRVRAAWPAALWWCAVSLVAAQAGVLEDPTEERFWGKPHICRAVWDNFVWVMEDAVKEWILGNNRNDIIETAENMSEGGRAFKECCGLEEGQRCCWTEILGKLCFREDHGLFAASGSGGALQGVYKGFVVSTEELSPGRFVAFFRGGPTMAVDSYWETASVFLGSAVDAEALDNGRLYLGRNENISTPSGIEPGGAKSLCLVSNKSRAIHCCNASANDEGLYRCATIHGTELCFDRNTQGFFVQSDGDMVPVNKSYDMLIPQVEPGRFAFGFIGTTFVEFSTVSDEEDEWALQTAERMVELLDEIYTPDVDVEDLIARFADNMSGTSDLIDIFAPISTEHGHYGSGATNTTPEEAPILDWSPPTPPTLIQSPSSDPEGAPAPPPSSTAPRTSRYGFPLGPPDAGLLPVGESYDDLDDPGYKGSRTVFMVPAMGMGPDNHRDCYHDDYTFEPLDMVAPTRVESPVACQERCRTTVGCAHFAYWVPIGHCHLQDFFAHRTLSRFLFISGPPICAKSGDDPPKPCYVGASRFSPAIEKRAHSSIDACIESCAGNGNCGLISFCALTETCFLHKGDGSEHETVQAGFASRRVPCDETETDTELLRGWSATEAGLDHSGVNGRSFAVAAASYLGAAALVATAVGAWVCRRGPAPGHRWLQRAAGTPPSEGLRTARLTGASRSLVRGPLRETHPLHGVTSAEPALADTATDAEADQPLC